MSEFRIVDRRTIHEGYAFDLDVVTVEDPAGARFERDTIQHRGAVAVVPLHDDGTVTLVRQYRAPLDEHLLELPAGLRDVEGEDTAVTATRELEEEAGLAAGSIELLTEFQSAPGLLNERVWVYLATGLTHVDTDRQGHEEDWMTIHRIPLAEAVDQVRSGAITDAKTVIGLLLAASR